MSGQQQIDFNPSGEVAVSSIIPILERLEHQISYVVLRVEEFIPRRHIPDTVKQRHREAIKVLGGRCPCCGINSVLDDNGQAAGEYDHFYSRERNTLEETWLICIPCHREMKDRARFTDQFKVYQSRIVAVEGGQLPLI